MTKPHKFLLLVVSLSLVAVAAAPAALGAQACTNEQLRIENNSTALPDCRAYELVSPDINHVAVGAAIPGVVAAEGDTLLYGTIDAPDNAQSGQALDNRVIATRNGASGWSNVSLEPPLFGPVTGYLTFGIMGVSADLSSTVVMSPQPLSSEPAANFDLYVGRPDGSYRLLTPVPPPNLNEFFAGGNADFSHVYFAPSGAELPSDPTTGGNTYSWTEAGGLHLVGILPNETPAPNGATLAGNIIASISKDASRAVFNADGRLYVRIDDSRTLEAGASERTIDPDPNPGPGLGEAGITASGSTVLFVAHSELTNDANTGESAGVATDAGADLYSYDVATEHLTDLTVDDNAADAATGANVQSVLGATPDGSYIYFTATGDLAGGATPGQSSLYVWHEGHIEFVADAEGRSPGLLVTADGRHAVFSSTTSLTGYDNADPQTGQPHMELFEATLGAGIVCVSCRVDGARSTADTTLRTLRGMVVASDDGRRVFFASADAVLPQATSGLRQVFEYDSGTVSAISRLGSPFNAEILGASPSGNDVFFNTADDPVPSPTDGDSVVFDARVGGGFPVSSRAQCEGASCRAAPNPPPVLGSAASASFSGAANLAPPPPAPAVKPRVLTRAQKLQKALKACKAKHNKKKRRSCEKRARKAYGRRR